MTILKKFDIWIILRSQHRKHDVGVGHKPIKQHTYRVNPAKRATMQKMVEYLLENGFAVPRSSPRSLPCLLVPKSDQTQVCTDFRKVDVVTQPDCLVTSVLSVKH